jgi:uncharacterized damage-inducible protein DinB
MITDAPEVWLRGPVDGVAPHLQPVAHALLQAGEEIERWAAPLTVEQLWARPGGAASVGFHLRHIVGVLDRLFTYARGLQLTDTQRRALAAERESGSPPESAESLVRAARRAIHDAVERLRHVDERSLLEPRGVGRAHLPSNVLGLLFHAAEHTQRHVGQIVATAQAVRAESSAPKAEG